MLHVRADTVDISEGTAERNLISSAFTAITPENRNILLAMLVPRVAGSGKSDAFFDSLVNVDCSPLQFISILLSFAKQKYGGARKVGNVCLAMAAVDRTLYITSNVNRVEDCDMTLEKELLSAEYRYFLKLFDRDAEFRKSMLKDNRARDVISNLNISDPIKGAILHAIHCDKNVEAVSNLSSERVVDPNEFDKILSDFCDIVNAWLPVAGSKDESNLAGIALEMLALYLPYVSDKDSFDNFFLRVHNPVFEFVVLQLAYCITGSNHIIKQALYVPLTAARNELLLAYKDIVANFPIVAKMMVNLKELAKYKEVVLVNSPDEPIGKVLHCEVKLYCYFRQKGIATANRQFIISKALCMDCSMFFFSRVDAAERPAFQATCLDHFQNVLCCTPCAVIDLALDPSETSKRTFKYFCGCRRPGKLVSVGTKKFSVYAIVAL